MIAGLPDRFGCLNSIHPMPPGLLPRSVSMPPGHSRVHKSEWYNVVCFAQVDRATRFMARFGGKRFAPADRTGYRSGATQKGDQLKGGHVETNNVETGDACRNRTSRQRGDGAKSRVGDAGGRPHRGKMRKMRCLKSRLDAARPDAGGVQVQGMRARTKDDVKTKEPTSGALGGGVALDIAFGDGAVAAAMFSRIQGAVASFEQAGEGLAGHELRDADRHGDARQYLAGRAACDLTFGNRLPDAFGNRRANTKVRSRQNACKLLAAVTGREVPVSHAVPEDPGYEPEHLVSELMAEFVVERLEVIDIEQEDAQRFPAFHRNDLRIAQEFVERMTVGQPGQGIGLGAPFRRREVIADVAEFLQARVEMRLQCRVAGHARR